MKIVSFLAILLLTSSLYSEPIPRVQVGPVLAGIDILKPNDSRAAIFAVTWKNNLTTNDGRFILPDAGVEYNGPTECSFKATTQTADSFEEYRSQQSWQASVSGTYEKFTGRLSENSQNVAREIIANQNAVSRSVATCIMYQLLLEPGLTPLDPYFLMRANLLPTIYNSSSAPAFYEFFQLFGTHFVMGAHLGGTLEQMAFTDSTYFNINGAESVQRQAEAKFNFDITGSTKDVSNFTQSYLDSTDTETARSMGGEVWKETDTWPEWAQHVYQLPNYRVRAHLSSLADLFQYSGVDALVQRANPLKMAILDYLTRPGCTDPRALNYNASATVNGTDCVFKTYPSFCPSCNIRNDGSESSCSVSGATCQRLGVAQNCYTGYNGAVECYCGIPHPPMLSARRLQTKDFPAGTHAYCGDQSILVDPSRQCCAANNPKNYDGNCAVCCPKGSIPQCSIMGKLANCICG